jgi:NADH dehydrogenase
MRVAVLGAGYAGLTVARQLERRLPDDADIVVVDESTDHLVQHELHRVIRHPSLTDAITVSLDAVLSRAEIREATITDIDTEAGIAVLDGEEELHYDVGAVCLGAETEFYGLEGVEEAAIPLKSLADAREIRERALDSLGGTVVVGGGGLSGIQAAGELAALSDAEDLDLEVRLVEMADQVAPGFDETFADAIRTELASRDVLVETGCRVEQADDDTVTFEDGRSIETDLFVWTGGIRGPASLDGTRQETEADLHLDDRTFVVGDAAALTTTDGTPVPASAQTAVKQGRVAAQNILALVDDATSTGSDETDNDTNDETGETADRLPDTPTLSMYEHQTAGWVVTVGDGAVATVGPLVFSGEPARAAKAVIGFGHLGSVGAIRQASELVAEELGWPTARGLGVVDDLEGSPASVLPTDPATPSQYSQPLTTLLRVFGETLPGDDPVDMTTLTRQFDTTASENILTTVQDSVFGPMQELLHTDDDNGDSEPEEMVTIDVQAAESRVESSGADDENSGTDSDGSHGPGEENSDGE